MQITLRSGLEVEVPLGLPPSGKGFRMSGAQEYLQTPAQALKRETQLSGIEIAARKYWGDVHSILHPFGGVGLMAQVLDKVLPEKPSHYFMERDEVCVKFLREQGYDVAFVQDSYKILLEMDLEPYDLVIMDQSAATVKEPLIWQVYEKLAASKVKHFWFNDSACSKIWLHLGTYSEFFGEEILWLKDYLRCYDARLQKLGLHVAHCMRRSEMMYLVVERGARIDSLPEIFDLRLPK